MSKLAKALTAAAGNAGESLYVEDVFSTYLYEGTTTSQSITGTGVDVTEEGGLVWIKNRTGVWDNALFDTINTGYLKSNSTAALASNTQVTLEADGFSFSGGGTRWNNSGDDYASWSFRKAEKFFDVVTYTGNGTAGRTVAHNLGSVPAVMIVKSTTNGAYGWRVYHQSLGNTDYLRLDETNAAAATAGMWNNTTPTDSEFTLGGASVTNGNGESFVAYLFASDAGGFGDDDENIIKCGSYTGNGNYTTGNEIDVGFEPQWLLIKNASRSHSNSDWVMYDVMRGYTATNEAQAGLFANLSNAETTSGGKAYNSFITSSGFHLMDSNEAINFNGDTYIYIAIRRPMKTPESGTEVFSPSTYAGNDPTPTVITTGFPVDLALTAYRDLANAGAFGFTPRLTEAYLYSATTAAEVATGLAFDSNTSFATDANHWNQSPSNLIGYGFKRATGFFDVVAYTGDGTTPREIDHNLAAVPEFIVTKRRDVGGSWAVYHPDLGITSTSGIRLNIDDGWGYSQLTRYPSTPTSTVYTIGNDTDVNSSGNTFVSYLWTTLAGVSKVGSYTGTGADLNIDCGFSAGARFVMIKRYGTSTTGDWYVWDSERGIVAGNDPYLLMNSTAAEVTSTDYIDPLNAGFTVTSSAPAGLNASGGTYIFLAIA